jgi:SPP1 family predicted phage head-tail adaptor
MRPGALRHRLILETASGVDDGGGGEESLTWEEVARLWAAIRPLGGREQALTGQMDGRVSHEIIMRWRSGVRPDMRLRRGGRVFHILAVMDGGERGRWLRLLCEERDL